MRRDMQSHAQQNYKHGSRRGEDLGVDNVHVQHAAGQPESKRQLT